MVCGPQVDKGEVSKTNNETTQESLRYFYNREVGSCQNFLFLGSGGNLNNFKSFEECEALCGKFEGSDTNQILLNQKKKLFDFYKITGDVYETSFDKMSADLIITQNHDKAPIFLHGIFDSSLADDVNDQNIEIMIYEDNFGPKCKDSEPKQVQIMRMRLISTYLILPITYTWAHTSFYPDTFK